MHDLYNRDQGGIARSCDLSISTVILCPPLPELVGGVITYSSDTFDVGTTATHACEEGFSLVGDAIRVCTGDGSSVVGEWNGTAPECSGESRVNIWNLC